MEASYEIELRQVPRRDLAVVKFHAKLGELGGKLDQAFAAVSKHLTHAGIAFQGPAVAHYVPISKDSFDVAAGFVVPSPISGDGEVMPAELPACDAAATMHVGSYDRLADAYAAIQRWMAENGKHPENSMWEEYWSDDPTPPRTDVYWPVKAQRD